MTDDYMVAGRLSAEDLAYLKTISQGSPLELYENPFVILSAPTPEAVFRFPKSEADAMILRPVRISFLKTLNVYNVDTHRTEFCVVMNKMTGAQDQPASIHPYFVWVVDPVRSSTVRSFLISLTNTMHADRREFVVDPFLVSTGDPIAGSYNALVTAEASK